MKKLVCLLLVLTMVGGLATTSFAASEPDASNPIKIGFEAWCSGVDAYFGLVAQKVMEDYLEIENANGGWLGRKVELIREQEVAAELIGVNVTREKMKSFLISAYFAGIAGGLYGMYYGYITPNTFAATMSNDLLAAVVFGGMGSVTGPVIAGAVLTSLPEVLRIFSRWRLVLYGLAMVVIMLVKPEGLLGNKELSLYPLIQKIKNRRKGKK